MRCRLLYFFLFALVACHAPVKNEESLINIRLSKDSQSITLSGLDYAVLQELKKDTLSLQSWQSLLPVYRMPADTDMADMQPEQPGTYSFTDSTVTFKPDTPFKKHQQYFTRFYGSSSNLTTSNLIRSKTNLKGQNYTEARFRF